MVEKSSPDQLWSAAYLDADQVKSVNRAREICHEWAERSMIQFCLLGCVFVALLVFRFYTVIS